jgi:hypothetical protein
VSIESKGSAYFFEVRFEQLKPHNLFKYEIVKYREEVLQLYVSYA